VGSGPCGSTWNRPGTGCPAGRTIHRALDLGVTFLDTADMYGPFSNERLVGQAIAGRREEVTLATKFGNERGADGSFLRINGTPEYVHQSGRAGNPSIVPIPGTKRVGYLEENAAAADVELTEDDLRALDEAAPQGATAGDRYPDMSSVHR
jgi:aryl-alcohol dehydrogenase-like predicted oxidoreductase